MSWPPEVELRGRHASLVPLRREHADALTEAVRDGELWQVWYTSIPSPERMAAEIERRLGLQATGSMLPFTVLDAQGMPMLLRHAFEALDCIAVEFRTHRLNVQSRRAIERLGAQLDGILRSHQRAADGTLRDTAVYSITAAEWPTVRSHLRWQLERPR
ncbi:MAG: GNAT family N-acetyltransferase [Burkholderiaceae bacterium]|nr:GNAT family N-acetyltransferase [Burkholderiaceae bacterium]